MSVLVYIESQDGQLKKSAFEVSSYAKELAEALATEAIALHIGEIAQQELLKLGKYGIQKILQVNQEDLKSFSNQAYSSILACAVKQYNIQTILFSHSFTSKEIAPRLAAKLQAALISGAIELPKLTDGKYEIKTTAFSNKAFAWVQSSSPIKVITIHPNSFAATENSVQPEIENFKATLADTDLQMLIKDIVKSSDKIPLTEAEIIVSAGRGMKGPENWGMIEELAELLGAATACSKPVSDAGWRPHSEHVGQTGIAVSPNLYIAIGISGAIQHLAGVSSSKTIVVINNDPEAPFFKVADYGIVGDAFQIVPQLIQALKSHKAH